MTIYNIISDNIRWRVPEYLRLGEHNIIDDYCYISTQLDMGDWCHIASNVTIAGGRKAKLTMGNYCCLASGVRVYCRSDDFVNDIATVLTDNLLHIKENLIKGDVVFGNHVTIGANSVVMPNNNIPDGVVVGALSFVPVEYAFEPWSVYAGNPIRFIKIRNKEQVLKEEEQINKATC